MDGSQGEMNTSAGTWQEQPAGWREGVEGVLRPPPPRGASALAVALGEARSQEEGAEGLGDGLP